ncbi:MAG: ABC transporter permease subunit [Treponema sp.]|nr:ABC transporter permease subunit [Treponema sp.]
MKNDKLKMFSVDFRQGILSIAARASVILLMLLLFIGRINPGRISAVMGKDVSLIKSAVYFRSLTEDVVSLDSAVMESGNDSGEVDPFSLNPDDFDNYDDYYAALFNMTEAASSVSEELDFDEDEDLDEDADYESDKSLKGVKIQIPSYKNIWNAFSESHEEIASGLKMDYIACLITCLSVLVALIGMYLSCGTNKLRKIGYIIMAAGGALTALSMILYPVAYSIIAGTLDELEVQAQWPAFRSLFLCFGILVLITSALNVPFGKSEITEKASIPAAPFQMTIRVLSLLAFVLLFIPGANPARISEKISRNMSLFTSGFFYKIYTNNLQLAFRRGWVPESIFRLVSLSALITDIGIIVCGVGACMSVGNNKLKRYGHFCLLPGSLIFGFAQIGILRGYHQEVVFGNLDRTRPLEPSSMIIYVVLAAVIFLFTLISFIKTPAPEKDEKCHIDQPLQLFLMLLPFLILIFIFSYLPLWGWRYAFFDYEAGGTISMDNWVGWKWFAAPFKNEQTRKDIVIVLRNTLAMSGLGILTSWCPMLFAIFLAEIKNNASRRIIQTLTTIPNFISWVLVYAIAFCIFGTEGFINNLLVKVLHVKETGTNYLMNGGSIWIKMLLWGMWKGLGWSAIMYIAAISGIDQQLYEAATVDGAGRFQKMWHITLPELIPTYVVLLILSISNILSNGMDQYLVFKNPNNKEAIQVLDLYVYQLSLGAGSGSNNIPFSTVVSMFKSVVSVILLFITNRISKIVRGSSIF